MKCEHSLLYFTDAYCKIEHPGLDGQESWIPFKLWPAQEETLLTFLDKPLVTVLKARQLGLSWLAVAYSLWLMLYRKGSVILMFSAGDPQAVIMLNKLKNMHLRLPPWMQAQITANNDHRYEFEGLGSRAQAFASTKKAGRSMTASLAIIDEADWIFYMRQVLIAVKPTIDAGGQLIMVSTADKDTPTSPFKRIWQAAHSQQNNYEAIFLPWSTRPDRDAAWYRRQVDDAEHLDDVYQEYPATPAEALAGRDSNRRFKLEWLQQCFPDTELPDLSANTPLALPGLIIYEEYNPGYQYTMGVDTCEGDPDSDPSPVTVFCRDTWREVAHLFGRFEPSTLASYLEALSDYYGEAEICVERNNHGHAVQLAIKLNDYGHRLYQNPHDGKEGWLSSPKYKTLAINKAAEIFKAGDVVGRTAATLLELGGLQAATLKALEGETDDRAMSHIIGLAALAWPGAGDTGGGMSVQARR